MFCIPQLSRLVRVSLCCLFVIAPAFALRGAAQRNAQHHPNRQARQEIERLEEKWKDATVQGDVAALERLLAEDFVGISWTGDVNTKDMQLDRLRNRTLVVRKMELSDSKIKIVGPIAIVTSRAEIDAANDGHDATGAYRYTRVYQRTPAGGWQITNSEATRIPNPERERMHKWPPPPASQGPPLPVVIPAKPESP